MRKILFISMSLGKNDYGGAVVSNTNFLALKSLGSHEIYSITILKDIADAPDNVDFLLTCSSSRLSTAFSNLLGFSGRLNFSVMRKIKKIIKDVRPDIIYLDSSLLGGIAKYCREKFNDILIVTFFHNVEVDFEISRILSGRIYFLPSLLATLFAEKFAVRHSDVIITLHNNDSVRLKNKYGREADYIVPVCIKEKEARVDTFKLNESPGSKLKLGFIGSAFFANIEAAKFISEKLAPNLVDVAHFYICGNGFERYESLCSDNVTVSGYIDSLSDFYSSIDVMVFPIFTGAGMKVKIAESLMYNKIIIASPFALIGYEKIIDGVNVISCDTNESFCTMINKVSHHEYTDYNRRAYLTYFSEQSCKNHFKNIFNSIEK